MLIVQVHVCVCVFVRVRSGSIWFYNRAWLGYENDERSRALEPKGKQTNMAAGRASYFSIEISRVPFGEFF